MGRTSIAANGYSEFHLRSFLPKTCVVGIFQGGFWFWLFYSRGSNFLSPSPSLLTTAIHGWSAWVNSKLSVLVACKQIWQVATKRTTLLHQINCRATRSIYIVKRFVIICLISKADSLTSIPWEDVSVINPTYWYSVDSWMRTLEQIFAVTESKYRMANRQRSPWGAFKKQKS